jgi:archaellum biogenesis ATPase FlaH
VKRNYKKKNNEKTMKSETNNLENIVEKRQFHGIVVCGIDSFRIKLAQDNSQKIKNSIKSFDSGKI